MKITIVHQGKTYVWNQGDDIADLQSLIQNLQRAIDEALAPAVVAASAVHGVQSH